MRIGRWYTDLDYIIQTYRRITQQGALLHTNGEKAAEAGITTSSLVAQLEQLLVRTARLVDNRRPFVHNAVEHARHTVHADEPVTTEVRRVDPQQPMIYQRQEGQWVPVTAAEILEQYANVPTELQET